MSGNPIVYFDVKIGDRDIGRLEIELFVHVCPKTAENFRALTTGERGNSTISGKPLSYQGTCFHRVISGFMCQGGDFTRGDGTGGECIYGTKFFRDENFNLRHDGPGILSMANSGPNTNGSQFFITFKAAPHLDGKHVVFGRVIPGRNGESFNVLRVIENVATDGHDRPKQKVLISASGQIGEDVNAGPSNTVATVNHVAERGMSSVLSVDNHDTISATQESSHTTESKDFKEESEPFDEASMSGMTDIQKRLFQVRMRMNQGRKANKNEVENEFKRMTDKKFDQRLRYQEWKEDDSLQFEQLRGSVDGVMNTTAETAERQHQKAKQKEKNIAQLGLKALCSDSTYRSYEKQLVKLPSGDSRSSGSAAASSSASADAVLNYGGASDVSASGQERLSAYIEEHQERRKKFSRRRMDIEASDVDYINDKNESFNKKIKRAFDKYTVEIRQNLERGTAI